MCRRYPRGHVPTTKIKKKKKKEREREKGYCAMKHIVRIKTSTSSI
jgi:hypothetical protein